MGEVYVVSGLATQARSHIGFVVSLQLRVIFRRLGLVHTRHMQIAFDHLVAFQLRLGHPRENVVVAPDVRHKVHRR